MICKNCGNIIPNGAAFCGKCGTPVKQSQPYGEYGQGNAQRPVYAGVGSEKSGKVKQMCIGLCAMHVLQVIFWFTSFMYASVSFMGMTQKESASIAAFCSEGDIGFFTPVFIILFIHSGVYSLSKSGKDSSNCT